MRTAVVTGASSGLGLEFTRQLLGKGWRVFAASRRAEDSPALRELKTEHAGRLSVRNLDVSDARARRGFAAAIGQEAASLDMLVNAAGIVGGDEERISQFANLDQEELARTFLVNSIAPLMMTELLSSLLAKGDSPAIANISSLNGSITLWDRPGKYSYCASKAALNMITKTLSIELRDAGIKAIALHPGWVKTWMTRNEPAPMEPEASIAGMLRVIDGLKPEDSGKFLDWEGNEIPW